ncbi:hypothetical protein OKW33_000420 [Paraburkholderia atlantica]
MDEHHVLDCGARRASLVGNAERVVRPWHREIARNNGISLRDRLLVRRSVCGYRLRGCRREPQDPAGAFDANLTSVPVDSVFHRDLSPNMKDIMIRAARRASVCQRTWSHQQARRAAFDLSPKGGLLSQQ